MKSFFKHNWAIFFILVIIAILILQEDRSSDIVLLYGSIFGILLMIFQVLLWFKEEHNRNIFINSPLILCLICGFTLSIFPSGGGITAFPIIIALLIPISFLLQVIIWLTIGISKILKLHKS